MTLQDDDQYYPHLRHLVRVPVPDVHDPGVLELPRGHQVQNRFCKVYTVHVYCVTRYLEARRLLAKAAQYRPAKYKKVSPATSPVTVSVSGDSF